MKHPDIYCPIMIREVEVNGATFSRELCKCDLPELKLRYRGKKECPNDKPCFLRIEHQDEVLKAQTEV